jgi:glycosyltransferase involved in cell wall biosynthesis
MAFAYHLNAASPGVQSGRPHSLLKHLRRLGVSIEQIFPLAQTARTERIAHKIIHKLIGQEYLLDRHEKLLRGFGAEITTRLGTHRPDVIFSPSTLPLSYLETDLPTCICADAPFSAMREYYTSFSRLGRKQIDLSERLERAVLERVALAVYPSRWAADSAISHYGLSEEKVAVIPFGANAGQDNQLETVQSWIAERPSDELRLLFVGLEWKRKGGPIVMDAVRWLEKHGFKVRLDIVGCVPFASTDSIRVHGRLRASQPEEARQLAELFQQSHFLFVPSRAEAYGMAFCEANAFGLPAIATATGGISEIVRTGVNGLALPLEADGADYGAVIAEAFAPATYRRLALSSFQEFATRLNWRTHCEQFLRELRDRLAPPSREPASRPPEISADSSEKTKPIRLAYVTKSDPSDPYAWSGINFAIRKALEALDVVIVPIGPLTSRWTQLKRAWSLFSRTILRKQSIWTVDPTLLRSYGLQVATLLQGQMCDAIFSPGTHPIAYLETDLPIVFWTDAPFTAMLNYYPWYSRVTERSKQQGLDCDDRALRRSATACYSSKWAANAAARDHDIDPAKIEVIPFGANLPSNVTEGDLPGLLEQRLQKPWRLLFVGVEWERKGGDLALEIARQLNDAGHPTELIVVGCHVPKRYSPLPAWVRLEGFVSQHTVEGQRRLGELYRSALFYLMPSQAEAYGIVFCEATSFAVPCLASDTGGVSSIVQNGRNGYLFPPDTLATEFARYIVDCASDVERYRTMMFDALRISQERLNWAASARRLKAVLEKVVAEHRPAMDARREKAVSPR